MTSHNGSQQTSVRVAVVTGAARGIGQRTCVRLAERGHAVVGVDVVDTAETGRLVADAGARWLAVQADLASGECGRITADRVEAEFGRCDILINNGAIDDAVSWDELTIDLWKRVLAINLDAPFHMCRALVPLMRRGGWGRIVNVASGSVLSPRPQFVAYRASKMGLIGFTRALATEIGDDGITVNAISPGVTHTAMALASLSEEGVAAAARNRAIHRVGEPNDVVGAILFLSSDDCAWVTGQTLLANGGAAFV